MFRYEQLFRQLPPTAVQIDTSDLWHGLAAVVTPDEALRRFRSFLVERTGNSSCYLVSSGRAGLTLALLGLKRLSDRSRVVVPAYGCPTIVQAVLAAGLEPVFCDVSPETLDLDRVELDRLVGSELLAIVAVHLYGLAQDVRDLVSIGRQANIFIVEDAAQAFGAKLCGTMVGNWGDVGIYSLGLGKCIPTGHGGVIVAHDQCAPAILAALEKEMSETAQWDIQSLVRFLGYGLLTRPTGWWFVAHSPLNPANAGMNFETLPPIEFRSLSAVQAGIGTSIIARVDQIQAICRRNARRMIAELAAFDFVAVPETIPEAEPVFLRLPIVVDKEERAQNLFDLLTRKGIGVSRSYRHTLPELFNGVLLNNNETYPGASRLANCLLTLPTHAYLTREDVARIARVFHAVDTAGG